MSTDGSRDLYDKFHASVKCNVFGGECKLIVVDNPRKEMHMAATRRLLFEEAKKIDGDKILFTLDADEFLSGNFTETEGWKTILNSEPGDVFEFRWMNLTADASQYTLGQPYYWALHVDEDSLNGKFPDNFIHEWRLPWPPQVNHEYEIDDIRLIHFARVNIKRQCNKVRFYQVSQAASLEKYSGIVFFRSYNHEVEAIRYEMPDYAYAFYIKHAVNVIDLLDLQDDGAHYTLFVLDIIGRKDLRFFRKLNVWDVDFLIRNKLPNPYRWIDKIMHCYLRATCKISDNVFIRGVDYILKKMY